MQKCHVGKVSLGEHLAQIVMLAVFSPVVMDVMDWGDLAVSHVMNAVTDVVSAFHSVAVVLIGFGFRFASPALAGFKVGNVSSSTWLKVALHPAPRPKVLFHFTFLLGFRDSDV